MPSPGVEPDFLEFQPNVLPLNYKGFLKGLLIDGLFDYFVCFRRYKRREENISLVFIYAISRRLLIILLNTDRESKDHRIRSCFNLSVFSRDCYDGYEFRKLKRKSQFFCFIHFGFTNYQKISIIPFEYQFNLVIACHT
jgi:hypothetical protein